MAEASLRILVSNDDGINAHGIKVLEEIARKLGADVWVVAPETNQSGAAHSLTLQRPLRVRRLSERHFAVDGTPTDAVLVGLQRIVQGKVDLVLSGINHGQNLGEDVTYSGTVAAAMEATLFGIPSVALSQVCNDRQKIRWSTAEHFAPEVIGRLLAANEWPTDVLMNVNFPDLPVSSVVGVRVTRQGKRKIGDTLIERIDPRGEPYLWIGALREDSAPGAGTDLEAVAEGFVSVTPIHLDMTHHASFAALDRALSD
ncbi:MAG: 5'/3'-nucleotidase SurE [Geminicoccaceae bacterium]